MQQMCQVHPIRGIQSGAVVVISCWPRLSRSLASPGSSVHPVSFYFFSRSSHGRRSTACAGRARPSRRAPSCRRRSPASSTTAPSLSNCERDIAPSSTTYSFTFPFCYRTYITYRLLRFFFCYVFPPVSRRIQIDWFDISFYFIDAIYIHTRWVIYIYILYIYIIIYIYSG